MPINFPTSLDNFTNPSSGNTLDSPSHSLQHSDINDAVEALEAKIGVGTAVAGSASAGQVLTISAAGTSTWSTPDAGGLIQIVPSSVAVGSGSGSVSSGGAVTFSGVSSISLNDVFNATYTNYRIICEFVDSGDANINLRWRVSGSDNSTSNSYVAQVIDAQSTTIGGSRTTSNLTRVGRGPATLRSAFSIDVFGPQLTQATNYSSFASGAFSNADILLVAGTHNQTVSYTGFTLIPDTGTMTGTIRVYGYKNG